jgi:hypothetical protein
MSKRKEKMKKEDCKYYTKTICFALFSDNITCEILLIFVAINYICFLVLLDLLPIEITKLIYFYLHVFIYP